MHSPPWWDNPNPQRQRVAKVVGTGGVGEGGWKVIGLSLKETSLTWKSSQMVEYAHKNGIPSKYPWVFLMNHTSLDTRKDWQNMYKKVKFIVYTCICHQIFSHMWIHSNSFFQAPLHSCWWNNPSRPGENLTFRKSGWSGWASQVKLSQKVWNSVGIKNVCLSQWGWIAEALADSPKTW